MATNSFGPQEVNLQIQPLPTYIDADGAFKINTPMLSTYNFDGLIPKKQEAISVTLVKPGYLIQINPGEDYYPVVSVEKDDTDLESTGLITFNYINSLGNTVSTEFDDTDTVQAIYEDWSEKVLGSQGWGITAGGNAIFTNVAVRGRIEADEGYISGNLTIGSSGATTLNDVATTDDLTGLVSENQLTDNTTTISGGNIKTGTIQSSGFATATSPYVYDGSEFSTNGMAIVLGGINSGAVIAENFKINPNGDASFRGSITAKSFNTELNSNNNYISIYDDGYSKSDVLAFYSVSAISAVSTRPGVLSEIPANIQVESKYYSSPTDIISNLVIRGWKPYGTISSAPRISLSNNFDGTSRSISSFSDNFYISGSLTVTGGVISGDGSGLTGIVSGTSYNYVLSTSGPSSPGSYADGTVWYVY